MYFFSHVSFSFFRGFINTNVELPQDMIFVYGKNGSGKTNFLEALNVLCLTKSFKPVTDKEITHFDSDFYFLKANVQNHTFHKTSCNYLKNKGKKVFHDDEPIQKFSEHIGIFPCVSLIPEDSEIIKDSIKRKKWFNLLFSQWDSDYLIALQKYEHALNQRNILLKLEKPFKELEPWTYQICVNGKILVEKRTLYFDKLLKIYSQIHKELGNWEVCNFFYCHNYPYQDINNDLNFYEKQLKTDFNYSYTTTGAHKDDVVFQINSVNLKQFGSQGQQKTFIIALKLAEYEFLSQNQKVPILLLDDVFEKLDTHRIQHIANYLNKNKKSQIFISHPSKLNLDFQPYSMEVRNHQIFVEV